jgi:hypothetical protein
VTKFTIRIRSGGYVAIVDPREQPGPRRNGKVLHVWAADPFEARDIARKMAGD